MTSKARTVDDMIAQLGRQPLLRIEDIPEREDVDRMVDAGVPVVDIYKWLVVDRRHGDQIARWKVKDYAAKRRSNHR